ncbi:hypothetical protein V5O48_008173 [Marasmius crinis-equi]|uniref:Carbohydrate esterase family 16 protein n=1 Tax=Marasmius crinis-equi TaxID=585013 RepID=A0ABR3FEQ3_9AGAR
MRVPLLLLSAFPLCLYGKPTPKAQAFDFASVKYVYAFGDSYSFVQGIAGHANFRLKLGRHSIFTIDDTDISSKPPSIKLEFLTGCFEGLPAQCEKQLWDFAFAGADIDATILPRHHDFTLQLVEQVDQWVQFASEVVPHPDNETLTAWWIGINDTGDSMNNASITDFAAFWEKEITSYFSAVQLAHDNGLKTHLFINVPPGDRSPIWLTRTDASVIRSHIQLYNQVLAEHSEDFASRNPGETWLSVYAPIILTHVTTGR